jgi:hypothetical protein
MARPRACEEPAANGVIDLRRQPGAPFGALASSYCGFGCDRYHALCFLRPNAQCAQKLFRAVVIDIRLPFQTVRGAMTISPASLQNLHSTSAMVFLLS